MEGFRERRDLWFACIRIPDRERSASNLLASKPTQQFEFRKSECKPATIFPDLGKRKIIFADAPLNPGALRAVSCRM